MIYLALIIATNVAYAFHGGPVWYVFALAGLTMAARDYTQEHYGRAVTVAFVVVGAVVSAFLAAPGVALASLVAFLLAETVDFVLWSAVRARWGAAVGVAVSGIVGSVVDSLVFLSIAFGSLAFLAPQLVGKIGATLAAAALVAAVSVARRRRP